MSSEVKAALITGILGLIAAIGAAIIGNNHGEKNAIQLLYSQITTINGSNNTVTINSVDDFIAQYIKLLNENETLKAQNTQYFADYTEQKNISNNLESLLGERPAVTYSDLGLTIYADDIPVNKNNSMVTIDGREYLSKEIVEKLLTENQNMTIKNNTLFIEKVVSQKTSLINEVIVDSANMLQTNNIKDSYGNLYTNALYPQNYHSYMIVNLNREFSFLKLKLAVQENGHSDAIVTIIADDTIVYTSPSLAITTEPFDVMDIPINNCSLLTIKIDSGADGGMGRGFNCLISDPIVYN